MAPRPRGTSPDERFMRRALSLAARGWGQVSPNPLVGAVVVRDGEIVGEGFHASYGTPHAEVVALNAAAGRARGATVYVSLEPCSHHGKTPPCVDALIAAGVSRVVFAVHDPNPAASGGTERLRAGGIEVDSGVCEGEAREINAAFLHAVRSDRPFVTLKLAVSLDSAIADHTRQPGWLTGDPSRAEVHRLRANSDAIAVGMGTVMSDDPALTVREAGAPRVAPRRVVFSRTGRLPLTSKLARSAHDVPVLVFAHDPDSSYEYNLRGLDVDVVHASSLGEALRELRSRGVHSLLVEGGAGLAGALLFESLVDRLVVFQAPVILGGGALNAFLLAPSLRAEEAPRLRVVRRESFGDDLMSVYAFDAS